MDLQEPVLKSLIAEMRFEPTPHFPARRADIIDQLMAQFDLKNWTMSEQFIQVLTEDDSRVLLQASAGGTSASLENIDIEDCQRTAEKLFDIVLARLNVESVVYVGVRTMWVVAADDFDSLNEWLVTRLSDGARSVLQPFGQKPSDSGWVFEFRSSEPQHVFRLGPMKVDQAITQVFRDKDPDHYPPQFLFFDIDRLYREPATTDEAKRRAHSSLERSPILAERVIASLKSELPNG
jgi:hypothetical protein